MASSSVKNPINLTLPQLRDSLGKATCRWMVLVSTHEKKVEDVVQNALIVQKGLQWIMCATTQVKKELRRT